MSGKPNVTRMVLTYGKPNAKKRLPPNLCKSVESASEELRRDTSVEKPAEPLHVFEHGTAMFKPTNNTRKLLNHLAKESDAPMRMEDIPIGPERTDLAFLALNIQSLSLMHKANCDALGEAKAALMNAQHDDPVVMDIIQRIMVTPLGYKLHEFADQLFIMTTKG